MLSGKKFSFKKVLIVIVVVIFAFSAISLVVTKIVYDNIFDRYDEAQTEIPYELEEIVEKREAHDYYSGENKLRGYLYRSSAKQPQDALVVIAPGFNASTSDYLWQIKSLVDFGWSVFIFDATGCCESDGESAVGFPQILLDLDETVKYIENNKRFGYNELVLFGHSRGGYAVCCALEYKYDIAAVVSISGINSAMEGIIGSSVNYVGPLAYGNYGGLWVYQAYLFGTDVLNMSAEDAISNVDVPVLIIHGNNDEMVPKDKFSIISHKDDIDSDNIEYILCSEEGQDGHTNLLFDEDGTANEELMNEINEFLTKSIK